MKHHDKSKLTAGDKRALRTLAKQVREKLTDHSRAVFQISLSDGLHIDQNFPAIILRILPKTW